MICRVALALLLAGSVIGCRPGPPPMRFALGPYRGVPSPELWERAMSAVRDLEYEPAFADPMRGQIVVPSKLYGTRLSFIIQLHRDGWVELSQAVGTGGYYMSTPSALAREQLELAADLHARMGVGEREAAARGEPADEDVEPADAASEGARGGEDAS